MFIRETIDNTALGLALRKPEPSPANAVKINAEIKINNYAGRFRECTLDRYRAKSGGLTHQT